MFNFLQYIPLYNVRKQQLKPTIVHRETKKTWSAILKKLLHETQNKPAPRFNHYEKSLLPWNMARNLWLNIFLGLYHVNLIYSNLIYNQCLNLSFHTARLQKDQSQLAQFQVVLNRMKTIQKYSEFIDDRTYVNG